MTNMPLATDCRECRGKGAEHWQSPNGALRTQERNIFSPQFFFRHLDLGQPSKEGFRGYSV